MPAQLICDNLDLLETLNAYRKQHPPGRDGAMASFVGSMRERNADNLVQSMKLEHYPAMTQSWLDKLCSQAMEHWQLSDILVVHRYGELAPGDDIVLVACWSPHRASAFDACRDTMERLKRDAPFWKLERTAGGERWVHELPDATPPESPDPGKAND